MQFKDGSKLSFKPTEDGVNMHIHSYIRLVKMTHKELNQLIEMLVNFQESHEWDKAKRGRDERG